MADTPNINNSSNFVPTILQNAKDISEIKAEITSINRRIDENDRLTNGIHQLAENVATMSVEINTRSITSRGVIFPRSMASGYTIA